MATVKIFLDNDEDEDSARDILIKALQTGGDHQERFPQPAAQAVSSWMSVSHSRLLESMLKEIGVILDEEFK